MYEDDGIMLDDWMSLNNNIIIPYIKLTQRVKFIIYYLRINRIL